MKGFEVSTNNGLFSGAMIGASSITVSDREYIVTITNDILDAETESRGYFADAMGTLAGALERASDEVIDSIRNGIRHFMDSSNPDISEEASVLYERIFMPALEM